MLTRLLFSFYFFVYSFAVNAESLTVAVSSNFIQPMKILVDQFESNTGKTVNVSYGSTGKLFAQISHGAPFDVFLSADQKTPRKLNVNGLAIADSQFTYAKGQLAMWVAHDESSQSFQEYLLNAKYQRIALANPNLAPYGAAAKQVLSGLSLLNDTQTKWILGESVGQAYQFVASGNMDVGFIARSQLVNHHIKGKVFVIPQSYYQPIRQDAILLHRAKGNDLAKQFLVYLASDQAKKIIQSYGYH